MLSPSLSPVRRPICACRKLIAEFMAKHDVKMSHIHGWACDDDVNTEQQNCHTA